MAKRWAAAAMLATEKNFRRVMGHKDIWLKAILDEKQGNRKKMSQCAEVLGPGSRPKRRATQQGIDKSYGAKKPNMSSTRCVGLDGNTEIEPFVVGTIAMLLVMAPSRAFSVAASGCDSPSGHMVR